MQPLSPTCSVRYVIHRFGFNCTALPPFDVLMKSSHFILGLNERESHELVKTIRSGIFLLFAVVCDDMLKLVNTYKLRWTWSHLISVYGQMHLRAEKNISLTTSFFSSHPLYTQRRLPPCFSLPPSLPLVPYIQRPQQPGVRLLFDVV